MEEVLALVSSLDKPAEFLDPSPQLKQKCLSLLPPLFALTVNSCDKEDKVSLPITELHTLGFEIEDVWQQIEMINKPLLDRTKHLNLQSLAKSGSVAIVTPQLDQYDGGLRNPSSNDVDNDDEDDLDEDMESGIEDFESDLMDDYDSVLDEEGSDNSNVYDNSGTDKMAGMEDNIPEGDCFFNMAEMESFVQQAEKQVAEDKNEDSDDDSIDLFDPDAGEEGDFNSEGSEADSEPQEEDQYYYKDFFDPMVPATTPSSETSQPLNIPLSAHQKKQKKISEHIARLEARNLEDKPWQMSGEVSSKIREQNSLLQEDLMYDHVTCPAPDITEEVTFALEDIIKQRIRDKVWDDVVRKEKPKEKPFNYQLTKPLDQEKSKLSLAEVYEQEYLKETQTQKQEQVDPRHEDIKKLMKKLFTELDALANFHFTPQMPEPEIKAIPNLPSIALEEVAPVTHSDAMLLAPEEIQDKSRKFELGKSERSETDKKRERRQKKKFQHLNKGKLQAAKERREKLLLKRKSVGKSMDAIKSSDKFFARLSEKVTAEVKSKKQSKRDVDGSSKRAHKLKHLKL